MCLKIILFLVTTLLDTLIARTEPAWLWDFPGARFRKRTESGLHLHFYLFVICYEWGPTTAEWKFICEIGWHRISFRDWVSFPRCATRGCPWRRAQRTPGLTPVTVILPQERGGTRSPYRYQTHCKNMTKLFGSITKGNARQYLSLQVKVETNMQIFCEFLGI